MKGLGEVTLFVGETRRLRRCQSKGILGHFWPWREPTGAKGICYILLACADRLFLPSWRRVGVVTAICARTVVDMGH